MPPYVWIVVLFFVAVPIGRAIARLIESKADRAGVGGGEEDAARLEMLERQVRQLARQVEGLQENQEFLTRLLESKAAQAPAAQIEEEKR